MNAIHCAALLFNNLHKLVLNKIVKKSKGNILYLKKGMSR